MAHSLIFRRLIWRWAGANVQPDILSGLKISQSGRFYLWQMRQGAKIKPQQVVRSSANMHIIPRNDAQRAVLDSLRKGDVVVIEGWLVDVRGPQGMRWKSSRSRGIWALGPAKLSWSRRFARKTLSRMHDALRKRRFLPRCRREGARHLMAPFRVVGHGQWIPAAHVPRLYCQIRLRRAF